MITLYKNSGNIRSVNVDYFGLGSEATTTTTTTLDAIETTTQTPIQTTLSVDNNVHDSVESRIQQQEEEEFSFLNQQAGEDSATIVAKGNFSFPRQHYYHLEKSSSELVKSKLETQIVDILIEQQQLTREKDSKELCDSLNSCKDSSSSSTRGVLVDDLIENHLKNNSIQSIDVAIKKLIKSGQLNVFQDQQAKSNETSKRSNKSQFSQQIINLRNLKLQQQESLDKNRTLSSSSTIKSKSTTLDSGIQTSWDLISATSSANCSSSERSEKFAKFKHELNNNNDDDDEDHCWPTKMVRQDDNEARQVLPVLSLQNKKLHLEIKEQQRPTRVEQRRSFSLGRSLSLRPSSLIGGTNNNSATTITNGNDRASSRFGWSSSSKSADRWMNKKRPVDEQTIESRVDELADKLRQEARFPVDKSSQIQSSQTNERFTKINNNLSSLFRSKSLRIISSGKNKASNVGELIRPAPYEHSKQATIDYLATAQPHKRTFSIRRNSLLTFKQAKDDSYVSSGSNYNTGKIVLFLRKLFSLKQRTNSHHHHHHHHRIVSEERVIKQHFVGSPNPTSLASNNSSVVGQKDSIQLNSGQHLSQEKYSNNNNNSRHHQPLANKRIQQLSTSPFSSSSSASSSLIEILDCSYAVNSSKRPLREENLVDISNNSAKATTFKLVRRSDSNLSHNSNKSNSSATTNSSSVSQQLRKHLDEAYKRHRKCTNQREKEFIDSINVLRQASRHALQSSSSSSCSQHQHQRPTSKNASRASGNIKSDETGSSRCSSLLQQTNEQHELEFNMINEDKQAPSFEQPTNEPLSLNLESLQSNCTPNCTPNCAPNRTTTTTTTRKKQLNNDEYYGNHQAELYLDSANNKQNSNLINSQSHHHNYQHQEDEEQEEEEEEEEENGEEPLLLAETQPPAQEQDHKSHHQLALSRTNLFINQANFDTTSQLNNSSQNHHKQLPSNCQLDHWLNQSSLNNNCQHLTNNKHQNEATCCICTSYLARLCPISSPTANSFCPNSCCPAPLVELPGGLHKPAPEAMSEYCCPLWRSMVYNYYPSFSPQPAFPMSLPATHQQNYPQQQQQQQLQQLNNLSTQQAEQQFKPTSLVDQNQQHNTTIDLKIEIGADFKKNKRHFIKGSSANRRLQLMDQRHLNNLNFVPEVKFVRPNEDSLESSDLTDESLNIKLVEEHFEQDSCETSGQTSSSNSGNQSDSSSNRFDSFNYSHLNH